MTNKKMLFKIAMVGDGAVGKTSIKQNFMGESFSKSYTMTIGADFAVKRIDIDGEEAVLQIWDTAGQQRFQSVRSIYYKGASGLVLVFDLTRKETFHNIAMWIEEATRHAGRSSSMVLVGNKADLVDRREVRESQGLEYAHDISQWLGQRIPYFETSALTGQNIEQLFTTLARSLVNKYTDRIEVVEKTSSKERTTLNSRLLEDNELLLFEGGQR